MREEGKTPGCVGCKDYFNEYTAKVEAYTKLEAKCYELEEKLKFYNWFTQFTPEQCRYIESAIKVKDEKIRELYLENQQLKNRIDYIERHPCFKAPFSWMERWLKHYDKTNNKNITKEIMEWVCNQDMGY